MRRFQVSNLSFAVMVGLSCLSACAPADSPEVGAESAFGDDGDDKVVRSCASANEGESTTLSCGGGGTITRVNFASYGTPNGGCTSTPSRGTCHAASSLSKVRQACLGQQRCTLDANNDVFGDPCEGVGKHLTVRYVCSTTNQAAPDNCPDDPQKTEPGACGCGVPEGTCESASTCPAKPAIRTSGCDGVLLTDPSSVEARSPNIAQVAGPAGATGLRFENGQSIDVKDAGCTQLGKNGADFSVSMWLKVREGGSQILGTTTQHGTMKPGFLLYTTRDYWTGKILLMLASAGPGFLEEVRSAPIPPNTWVHVVLRYDGNDDGSNATLDVNLERTSGPVAANVYNDRLRVGDEGYGDIEPFEISELRSYGRLLTSREVQALFLDRAQGAGRSASAVREALTTLENHLNGTATVSESALATALRRFSSGRVFVGTEASLMNQAFRLVETYEAKVGPLFLTPTTQTGFERAQTNDGRTVERFVISVQQALVDFVYGADNVQACASQLSGKRFRTADYFPGAAPPPEDPNRSYRVTVDATLRADWGRPVAFSKDPVRRPTGLYVSPGSVAEVRVPQGMVNSGFEILVGAHTRDLSERPIHKRMDRVFTTFPITRSVMRVANPLGGGLYIVVPYLAKLGKVNVEVKNVIEAPFFSYKSWDQTTAAQWSARRRAPAPWADFETDKFMMQVPRSWIFASGDPTNVMQQWDAAMDGVSELLGYPPEMRNRTVLYQQIDVALPFGVYGIGYPQVNNSYSPHDKENGNKNHWLLRNPAGPESPTDLHELGHAQNMSKFRGEEEAIVNILYPFVRHLKFGASFDQAFAESMEVSTTDRGFTPDDAARHWMVTHNFREGREMDHSDSEKNEMRYQHRGYAKYADIYRLFGRGALGEFFYQENVRHNRGNPSDGLSPTDSQILRLSMAVGADLTPLIHFWGIFPTNRSLLKQKLAQADLGPSEVVRNHLVRYRSIVLKNNAEFNALYERVYPGRPGGESPDYGQGWFDVWRDNYNEGHAQGSRARIDQILRLYY